jgi:hypothetical protein
VIRDYKNKTIQLVYNAYIEKVAKKFNLNNLGIFPATPLATKDLYKNTREITIARHRP